MSEENDCKNCKYKKLIPSSKNPCKMCLEIDMHYNRLPNWEPEDE